jgi:hypothetical protein
MEYRLTYGRARAFNSYDILDIEGLVLGYPYTSLALSMSQNMSWPDREHRDYHAVKKMIQEVYSCIRFNRE